MGRLGGRGADGMGWGMGKGEWGGGGWGGIGSETLSITMEMKYIFCNFAKKWLPVHLGINCFSERDFRLAEKNGRYFSVISPENG